MIMATEDEQQYLPRPDRPLKILTIDGGGLQAIATLLILDKVMDKIASKDVNGTFRRPRPCDVFDTIAGIGAGGWLAILLGRFRMDITTCLTEWYNLMDVIQPKSKLAELKNRVHHQYYDPKQLVEHINCLTELYGTGYFMAEEEIAGRSRCKHVFVAGLPEAGAKYNLFRTYQLPKHAKAGSLLPGPESPDKFTIASAFGVTGAAKYFTPTWKEKMKGGRKVNFRDNDFPIPHNVTELALDEMWGLYGPEAPVCLVVNIGPGLPNNADIEDIEGIAGITRRITWPPGSKSSPILSRHLSRKKSKKSTPMNETQGTESSDPTSELEILQQVESPPSPRSPSSSSSSQRVNSHDVAAKMQQKETEIEQAIEAKLRQRYVDARYYRLALGESPPRAPQCDALNPRQSTEAVDRYCKSASGMSTMERVGEHFEQTMAAEHQAAMRLAGGVPREVFAAA